MIRPSISCLALSRARYCCSRGGVVLERLLVFGLDFLEAPDLHLPDFAQHETHGHEEHGISPKGKAPEFQHGDVGHGQEPEQHVQARGKESGHEAPGETVAHGNEQDHDPVGVRRGVDEAEVVGQELDVDQGDQRQAQHAFDERRPEAEGLDLVLERIRRDMGHGAGVLRAFGGGGGGRGVHGNAQNR